MTAAEYLRSYKPYFWEWEDDAEVISIPEGSTVVYRSYLKEVIEVLADQGLPPLGTLLLTIIATNPRGTNDLKVLRDRIKEQLGKDLQEDVFKFLNDLSSLPPLYRLGEKRLLLFRELFRDCHNRVSAKYAPQIIEGLENLGKGLPNVLESAEFNEVAMHRELSVLSQIAKRYRDNEDLILCINGLPDLQEVPQIPEEPALDGPKDLVQQLIEDYHSFHVGSLIKSIWSGLDIPFHNNVPSEQPIGGVSDLTNKGDFDRLLVSEYANDDLVFLSRLANNEALFLNRETPPSKSKLERVILLDASLKTWGTPKAIAHAIMLAIAKHPQSDFDCKAFAVGNRLIPLAMDTKEDVLEGLMTIDAGLSAAEGMELFFVVEPFDPNQQVVFITSEEAVKSKELQHAFSMFNDAIDYRIVTSIDGGISLYKNQGKSLKQVQDIKLPLDKLWEKKPAPIAPQTPTDRLLKEDQPILHPSPQAYRSALVSQDGQTYVITIDGNLLRLYQPNQNSWMSGWEQINGTTKIPSGQYDVGRFSTGELIVVSYNVHHKKLYLVNLGSAEIIAVAFAENIYDSALGVKGHKNRFLFYQDAFHCHSETERWSLSKDGVLKEESDMPETYFLERMKIDKDQLVGLGFQSVLRKVKSVSINSHGSLMLNQHELVTDHHRGLLWMNQRVTVPVIKARRVMKGFFEFPNGSRVDTDEKGICWLRAPGDYTIYIPTVLDYALGVATDSEFAGNPYFKKQSLYLLTLVKPSTDKQETIRCLQGTLRMGVKRSEELAQNTPCALGAYGLSKAEEFKKELEKYGAQVSIKEDFSVHPHPLAEVSTDQFYEQHIKAFTQNIFGHGT